jgi:hypothetical protein
MPVKPRIKFAPGKTYVYSGSEGVYSVIAGELLEGDATTSGGGGLSFGNGSPLSLNGKDGDVYLDLTDFKVHTKSAGSWSAGSVFKGTNGSNGAAGANGKSVRFGNGSPSSGLGDNDDVYFDLTDFKLHTKSSGSWTAGSAFKGTNGAAGAKGASLLQGTTTPSAGDGDDGDTFLDAVNHTIFKKTGGSWVSQGSTFKGATGSTGAAGTNGNTVHQGTSSPSGATGAVGDTFLDTTSHVIYKKTGSSTWTSQGSSFKGATGSTGSTGAAGTNGNTVHQGSGAPSSGTGSDGDTFLDTTSHVIYKKSAGSWASQGSSFKGATGAGVSKFSCALSTDTYISTGGTQSAATTAGSTIMATTYPATLFLEDGMEDAGGIVTRTTKTYRKNGSDTIAGSLTGSRFTINTAGRYKIEYNATFNVQAASASANSVDLTAFIDYSTDDGATYTTMVTQTATMTTASTTAAQTTLELNKTIFLPANTTIFFKAKRGTSTVNTVVSVNAITKSEIGDDTFVVITKL